MVGWPEIKEKMRNFTVEENLEFMTNEERISADKELRERKKEVEIIAGLSIQTILTTMPQAVKNLQRAYEHLNIIEAKLENEIITRRTYQANN